MKPSRPHVRIPILSCLLMFSLYTTALGTGAGPYVLRSKVIIAEPHFLSSFDVVLLLEDGVQEVRRVRATSMVDAVFPGLDAGVYVLEVNVPGFKKARERVNIRGLQTETSVAIFVERPVVVEPAKSGIASVRDYDAENLVAASDLGKFPKDLTLELETAQGELLDRNYDGALGRLNDILERFPDYYPAIRDRGVVYQKLGSYVEARSDYAKAQALMSSSPVPLIYMAGLSLLEARTASPGNERMFIRDAGEDLLKAIEIWPHSSFAHYLLGVTYYEAGFYEDAEDSLMHALNLDPQFAEIHIALANLYMKLQEWDSALLHLDTYLAEAEDHKELDNLQSIRSRLQKIVESEPISFKETGR